MSSVTITPTTQTVVAGSTTPAFAAVTKDAGGNTLSGRAVTFASSNTGVATIDPTTGVATGVAPGTATITATSEGITSNAATLTVTPVPVSSVTLAPSSQNVVVGSTVTFVATPRDASNNPLSGRMIVYGSSNDAVATISTSGVATGITPGTVTIGAISEGKNATASLTVIPVPVASVDISPPLASTTVGSTVQFTATPRDAGSNALTGRIVTWTSSDQTKATVDNAGLVTAVAVGLPTITATSETVNSSAAVVTIGP